MSNPHGIGKDLAVAKHFKVFRVVSCDIERARVNLLKHVKHSPNPQDEVLTVNGCKFQKKEVSDAVYDC